MFSRFSLLRKEHTSTGGNPHSSLVLTPYQGGLRRLEPPPRPKCLSESQKCDKSEYK